MIKIFLTLLLVFLMGASLTGYSQLLNNPSFEGTPQTDSAPTPWKACNAFSSPDTQPGSWNVTKAPSHGKSYLGLVTRGNLGPYANINEAAQLQLNVKLIAGKTYLFSVDLAFSETQGHEIGWGDFLSYAHPAVLKIWGGVNSCEKTELLWESPVVNHPDWKPYPITIKPQRQDLNYLVLEANHSSLPSYFGNILIDNMVEIPLPEPAIINLPETEPAKSVCSLEAFDVFTPNGDGLNDVFLFKPGVSLAKSKLKIYNRYGREIYETDDLEKGWDGKINGTMGAAGVYYWYIEYWCINGNQILDNKLKGYVTLLH
jgi:gliding motility-associated-like protein